MRLLQQRICSLCMCRIFPLIVMGAINNYLFHSFPFQAGVGRVVRWCWVNFQCRGVLLIWIIIGQGPIALAVGAGGVVWTFFSLLSPYLREKARYRLKYCHKGPLSPKQPTNQPFQVWFSTMTSDKRWLTALEVMVESHRRWNSSYRKQCTIGWMFWV